MRIALIGLAILAVAVGAGYWWYERHARGPTLPAGSGVPPEALAIPADDPDLLALGEAIYARECAACHGAELEGEEDWRRRGPDGLLPAPPHDETGHTWHHPDVQLFAMTKFGIGAIAGDPDYRTAMPAYRDVLEDEEIIAVLAYIKSRWPEHIRERHAEFSRQAARNPEDWLP